MDLKTVAKVRLGYPFRGKIMGVDDAEALAVRMSDVSALNGVNWGSCVGVELAGKKKPDWLKDGDILFAARGSQNYAALVTNSEQAKKPAVASPYFYVVQTTTEQLLPAFLAWWLNQPPCQKHFLKQTEGTRTKSVRRRVLESAPVIVPALKQQQAIVKLAANFRQQTALSQQLIHNSIATQAALANELAASDEPIKQQNSN